MDDEIKYYYWEIDRKLAQLKVELRRVNTEIDQEKMSNYVREAWQTRKEVGSNTSVPIVIEHEPRPVVIFRSKPIRGIVLELWSVR